MQQRDVGRLFDDIYFFDESLIRKSLGEDEMTLKYAEEEFTQDNWVNFVPNDVLDPEQLKEKLLALSELFDNQNHSGFSANYTLKHFLLLARYQELKTGKNCPKIGFINHAREQFYECDWVDNRGESCDEYQDRVMKDLFDLLGQLDSEYSDSELENILVSFERLAQYKPLTPLTGSNSEWKDTGDHFQNLRCSSVFKEKDTTEKSYDIDATRYRDSEGRIYGMTDSRRKIEFPYFPPARPEIIPEPDSKIGHNIDSITGII